MSPACTQHRSLVDRVIGGEPTDAELLAYADEVPDCAACRQALAVASRVHPQVLVQGGRQPATEVWADPAMDRLLGALEREPRPRRRWLAGATLLLAAAAAALALWGLQPTEAPVPAPAAPAPQVAVQPPVTPAPSEPALTPVPKRAPTPDNDAVAVADWQPPPWEDARQGTPKGISGTLSLALVLGNASPVVGDVVPLTVTASQATPATLCVDGPEQGVVWRGSLPEGRTALAQDGQPIGFSFDRAGDYRFALSTTDDPGCADPVQRVTVRVAP